jgi:hypothetical protein
MLLINQFSYFGIIQFLGCYMCTCRPDVINKQLRMQVINFIWTLSISLVSHHIIRMQAISYYGPVHPAYNLYFSTYFFSRNSIFLSQQISQEYFSTGLRAHLIHLVRCLLFLLVSSSACSNWTTP